MSKKKKVYIGLVIVLIIIALVMLFSGKVASQKRPEQEGVIPVTTGLPGQVNIPDNMSISDEIGG